MKPQTLQSRPFSPLSSGADSRRRGVVLGALACVSVGLSGRLAPPRRFRYRLTVELGVDARKQVGSAVREALHFAGSGPMSLAHNAARGSAIVFDLGERGASIVSMLAWRPPLLNGMPATNDVTWCPSPSNGRTDIALDAGPMCLRLKSVNDPSEVRYVAADRMAESFGPGVSLLRMYIEPTHDPMDRTSVLDQLPWARDKIKSDDRFGEDGSLSIGVGQNIAAALNVKGALIG